MKRATFILTDHMCRHCGGRILQQANSGPTGGGNPIFRCADYGKAGASMSPGNLCWCGFHFKGQVERPYLCKPFKGNEHLELEFAKCGCFNNGNHEIGIIGAFSKQSHPAPQPEAENHPAGESPASS